MEKKIIELN